MNREILYEIMISKSEKLSYAEIESIMNEELDKSPDEMDTDLVDLCVEALSSANEKQLNKKKHHIRISKVLIAAVIFVLVIGISIPAFARFLSIDVPQGIVTIYKECFNVDISNDKYVNNIVGQLEQDGIENVVLPKCVYFPSTKIDNYAVENLSEAISVDFNFNNNDSKGHISIKSNNINQQKTPSDYEHFKFFELNGITILVVSNGDYSFIQYENNNLIYDISINCGFETACEIAETI